MRFVLVIALVCIAAQSGANIPCEEIRAWTDGGYRVCVVSPGGTAPSLAGQGVVIHVEILDCLYDPIVNFPRQDIWLSPDGELNICPGGAVADANTDENGQTTFSGAIFAGGHSVDGVTVWVNGTPTMGGPLPLDLVSPDLDGNLLVNLVDFAMFGQDYGSATRRSDLVPDGVVNLPDFARFGQHHGEACP